MRSLFRSPGIAALSVVALASVSQGPGPRLPARPSTGHATEQQKRDSLFPHEFYYTRGIYTGLSRWGGYGGYGGPSGCGRTSFGCSWTTDYPKSDRQFLVGVNRLLDIDLYRMEHPVRLDDPQLNRFPFLYMVEVGHTNMTDSEITGLRRYLEAGGFLVVDDFWGSWEWEIWESQISRVFPEYQIVELPLDHPIFNTVYPIKEILQVPNVGNAHRGITYEQDGYVPHCRGIFDRNGRLLVVINWNTDMGDAWEWAEDPYYPLKYSTFAWEMAINFIVYAMSH